MAAASRTLVRLAGETELHRTPLEGVLSPVARFRGPRRVPNSEAVRRLLVRLHEFPHPVLANESPRPPLSMSPAGPGCSLRVSG